MFEYINKILYKTKGSADNVEQSEEFQPFLVQRWCSMYSPQISDIVNQTSNRVWTVLDKEMWFKYLNGILPACKFKRINYIKKKKDTETKAANKQSVTKLANYLEISSREVNLYIEQFNLQLPNEKKHTT